MIEGLHTTEYRDNAHAASQLTAMPLPREVADHLGRGLPHGSGHQLDGLLPAQSPLVRPHEADDATA
ncbi:hypothetical protein [Streptomyces sp. NPDC091416]|uniref:hypothetical protein n=1 Tax=Streptomyces sp. NPDC091416 TaxID=3366003 RepID=UPI0037F43D2F